MLPIANRSKKQFLKMKHFLLSLSNLKAIRTLHLIC